MQIALMKPRAILLVFSSDEELSYSGARKPVWEWCRGTNLVWS